MTAKCYAFGCPKSATFLVQSEQESGFEGEPSCGYHGELLVDARKHPAYLVFVGEIERDEWRDREHEKIERKDG